MENASKALLMAGGILIALLIISLLLLMITNIGDYQRTKDSGAKATQIAKFNRDFERYTKDEIRGTDIISIINKIQDYNSRQVDNTENPSGTTNYVDYNIKMSITISGLNDFNEKYKYEDNSSLFKQDQYTIGIDENGKVMGNKIANDLKEFVNSENATGLEKNKNEMKYLSSIYLNTMDNNRDEKAKDKIRERLIELDPTYKNWQGDTSPTLDSIKKYSQYSEFKSSKFISDDDREIGYENGQIQALFFKFVE